MSKPPGRGVSRPEAVDTSRAGIAFVAMFLILANANAVFSGRLLQSLHPFTFLFWSFLVSALFFGTIRAARHGLRALAVPRESVLPLALLNTTSACTWVGYFFALRYIEPAIVSAMMGGLGPLTTIGLDRLVRGRRFPLRIYVPATGVFLGAALLAWASLTGRSGLSGLSVASSVIGLTAAAIGGIFQALNTVATKQLGDRGWTSTGLMTHRFYLLIAVAAVAALSGPGLQVGSPMAIGMMLAAAVMGTIAPLWPLQRGIILSEPFAVAVMLSLAPILTYFFQAFDDRLSWSAASAIGCVLIVVFTVQGSRINHQQQRERAGEDQAAMARRS